MDPETPVSSTAHADLVDQPKDLNGPENPDVPEKQVVVTMEMGGADDEQKAEGNEEMTSQQLDDVLSSPWHKVAEWLGVLCDMLNLSEQLFVYFLVENGLTGDAIETVFLIFLGVGFGSAAGKTFRSPRIKVLYSILVESAELAVYLTLESIIGQQFDPETKRTFTIGVSTFYGVQVLVLLAQFPMVERTRKRLGFWGFIGKLFLNLFQYTSINTFTIIFVYLDLNSRLRQTWFEVLTTVVIFMSNSLNDLLFNSGAMGAYLSAAKKKVAAANGGNGEDNGEEVDYKLLFKKMREKSLLPAWYLGLIYILSIGLSFTYLTASIVYSIQHLQEHDNLGVPLLDYDRGVYVYFVVVLGIVCCPIACLCLCLPFICCCAFKASD